MKWIKNKAHRVLAFSPNTNGFGFVVYENTHHLIDWGRKATNKNCNAWCLKNIEMMLVKYQPVVLVVEDCSVKSCRRGKRVKSLIDQSLKLADKHNVETCPITIQDVKAFFKKHYEANNKHQIAQVISKKHTQELGRKLPPKRKLWMSEDARMSIFSATALAWTCYALSK